MALRVNVLGPITAEVDGVEVALGGLRQRAVLAVLVAARGQVVSAERVLDAAWGNDEPPSMPTLHSYIARLRKALEPDRTNRTPSDVLARVGNGYTLRVEAEAVDAERFVRLIGEGQLLLESGAADDAATVLGQAVRLWGGQPYGEFAAAAFAVPEIARLEGLYLSARESLCAAQLALGRHAAVVPELEKLTAEQPTSERAWELLVLALYRAGRQGDALAALRAARGVLAEELGLDPGPALRELESAVLAQDDSLLPAPAPARPETAAAPAAREPGRNLPFPVTGLVGRDIEIAQVTALLAEHRLVTLTGPGGIGKTRLALETAHARTDADGPWLIELAGLSDPALLPATIAQALGLSGPPAIDRIALALRGRGPLLVLDNCEHLVEAVGTAVSGLLAGASDLRVLATSRETLGVPGEALYDVPPLSRAESRDLFLTRARAATPGWQPTSAELEQAGLLCAGLDGLPLAVELAAGQCRMLSIEQMLASMDDRFAVLTSGPGPRRHQTLAQTVEWSYDLLEPAERELFHRLAVFAAGFDLDAAAAVCGRPVLAGVRALVRKSLVAVEPGTSPRRYRMLETLKEFARAKQDPAELTATQAAHRAWVLARAQAAEARLRGDQATPAMDVLMSDQPEHRAAFTSALLAGEGEYALRLSGALSWFWYRRGHVAEGLGWLSAAMELSPDTPPETRTLPVIGMAGLYYLAGDFAAAHRTAGEAAEISREAGNLVAEAQALTYRALFGGICGMPNAVAEARIALDLSKVAGLRWLEAEALMGLGMLLLFCGEVGEARESLTESLTVAEESGHRFVIASSTWLLMKIDLKLGRADRVLRAGLATLRLLHDDRDVTSWLVGVHTVAAALTALGRPHDGARLLGAVEARAARVGFSPLEMDPVDGQERVALIRQALPADELAECLRQGSGMTPAQVHVMLDDPLLHSHAH
ncbi:AfsR/SARP family transcriptional regulator [Nonomuraea sp. NN258]|uniref:BTAD domain-containing putative transcriptional regulator n=1 Tax=Nonomuraea antri TaxID=2730852 RepID=UPI001568FEF4|nr:BTAD domain-containing putative transcriptional regulator [Nonomuraea antri]NRQ30288.1 AfsR/SARP family transcriptional regulator [Nonomuraea antri]